MRKKNPKIQTHKRTDFIHTSYKPNKTECVQKENSTLIKCILIFHRAV